MRKVIHLALNLHGERETSWFLAVIGLQTHAMSIVASSHTFQDYLEVLRGQLTERLPQLDAEFKQPRASTTQGRADEDDDDDTAGIELRQVATDLERLQEHCAAVELREREQRRRAEEQQRQEDQQRREEEKQKIRETFRYKHLVNQEVASRQDMIRVQAMRQHQHEFRRC